jgi:UDP-N-acetylglucosamine 2-epimerase (non-hydrolysing)
MTRHTAELRLRVLSVFGTRPEAIKMAPVVKAIEAHPDLVGGVCVTGQHRKMLDQVLGLFEIKPDYDLGVMQDRQTLTELMARILSELDKVLDVFHPDLVLVHGDTTTTLSATLAAFHRKIPVGHVEAGLRTRDLRAPFPEEANRCLSDRLATLHFAPTLTARRNLEAEGISQERMWVTGNTGIDALLHAVDVLAVNDNVRSGVARRFQFLNDEAKLILVTGHRRENFGGGLVRICEAIRQLATLFPDHAVVYPVHLNPNVLEPVGRLLSGLGNVHLVEPLDYMPFVYLMQRSRLILTDSGGIQEEAPSLGRPVLVLRDTTERPEAIAAGTVRLVGTDVGKIVQEASRLLTDGAAWSQMATRPNPYGDGRAAERIVTHIISWSGEARRSVE